MYFCFFLVTYFGSAAIKLKGNNLQYGMIKNSFKFMYGIFAFFPCHELRVMKYCNMEKFINKIFKLMYLLFSLSAVCFFRSKFTNIFWIRSGGWVGVISRDILKILKFCISTDGVHKYCAYHSVYATTSLHRL